MEIQETMQQYVKRKLNEPTVNIVQVAKELNMNRSKIYRIRNGGETQFNTLQTLHDYFRKAAD